VLVGLISKLTFISVIGFAAIVTTLAFATAHPADLLATIRRTASARLPKTPPSDSK
jgi:hypothetical protein